MRYQVSPKLFDGVHPYRIDRLYEMAVERPIGSRVHATILRELAAGKRVLELGVCFGMSTAILLSARPTQMISADIRSFPLVESFSAAANELDVWWRFIQADTTYPAPWIFKPDFMFVDTLHTYDQVKAELSQHVGPEYPKVIAFHDTVLYGDVGDGPMTPDGAPPEGINRAIEEFRADNPEWRVKYEHSYIPFTNQLRPFTVAEHHDHGCGLLVLER
jgi:hypothetical protein